MYNKTVHMVTFILLAIGGLNWGLEGAFNWGVENVLGDSLSRIVFILVGLSALYELIIHRQICKGCAKTSAPAPTMEEGGGM